LVRALTVAEYGAFAFALSVVLVSSDAIRLGLHKGVARFVPIHEERQEYGELAGVIVLVLSVISILGVAMIGLVYLTRPWFVPAMPDQLSASLLLILIFLGPIQALDLIMIRLLAIFATPAVLAVRRHLLMPILKLSAVSSMILAGQDVEFLAAAWVVATGISIVLSVVIVIEIFHRRSLLPWFRPQQIRFQHRQLFRFSIPLVSSDVVSTMRTQLVVFLLGIMQTAAAVASFRAVLPLARLNLVIFDSFKTLYMPAAARMYARNDMEGMGALYWQACSWILVFTFPLFLTIFCLAEPLTVQVFGERYAGSGNILRWLSIGIFLNAVAGTNALSLEIVGRVRTVVAIDVLTLLSALVLNVILIWAYGAIGGAIASCATLIIRNIGAQWVLMKDGIVGRPMPAFIRVGTAALALTIFMVAFEIVMEPDLFLSVTLVCVAAASVFLRGIRELGVSETFPELNRIPGIRILSSRTRS
jgi:O-antigen/teichoic acid export membrane protein